MSNWDRESWWRLAGVSAIVVLGSIVAYGLFVPERTPVAAATQEPRASSEPTPDAAPVVVFLGDSYTAGARTTSEGARWVNLVAAAEGWEFQNLARGGTGFVNGVPAPTAQDACGLDYCPSFTEVVTDAAAVGPQIVVVSGGRNDANQNPEEAAAAVEQFYTALRAALPDATIIATNVLWDATEPPETIAVMSEAVRVNVERVGGQFVDLGQPLTADMIDADGVHPNDAGHQTIADLLVGAL